MSSASKSYNGSPTLYLRSFSSLVSEAILTKVNSYLNYTSLTWPMIGYAAHQIRNNDDGDVGGGGSGYKFVAACTKLE